MGTTERTGALTSYLKWILANAIAWLVGFGLISLYGHISLMLFFGLVVGLAQGSVIQHRIAWKRWLLASVLGWAFGALAADVASRATPRGMDEIVAYVVFGAAGGGSTALLQFLLQWRRTHPGIGRLFALGGSGLVGGALGGWAMWALIKAAFDAFGMELTNAAMAAETILMVGAMIAGGALFGLVTAFPVVRLQES